MSIPSVSLTQPHHKGNRGAKLGEKLKLREEILRGHLGSFMKHESL